MLLLGNLSSIKATSDEEQKSWDELKQRVEAEAEANGLYSQPDPPGPFRDRFWDVGHRGGLLPDGSSAVSMKGAFKRPIGNSKFTSTAMEPRDLRGSEIHRGPDIRDLNGNSVPVYAAYSGTVESVGTHSSYGINIIILHDNSVRTRYAHLSETSVTEGTRVYDTTVIGKTGNTGDGSGNHLHFEIYFHHNNVNHWLYPSSYFLGSSDNPDYVGTPTVSGRLMSVPISVYSLNEPYSKVYIVYRVLFDGPQLRYSEWAQAELTPIGSGTTRTFTWNRPQGYDNLQLEYYIAGRYWQDTRPDDYKRFIATRPAGGYVTETSDPTEPLGVYANPGRYYFWGYIYGE